LLRRRRRRRCRRRRRRRHRRRRPRRRRRRQRHGRRHRPFFVRARFAAVLAVLCLVVVGHAQQGGAPGALKTRPVEQVARYEQTLG